MSVIVNQHTPTSQELDQIPGKVVTFLHAVGTDADIRQQMVEVGFNESARMRGWNLALTVAGYRHAIVPPPASVDEMTRDAVKQLDAWDGPGFRRVHACLAHLFPEQDQFVFDGLAPQQHGQSVVAVGTLLDRLDQLESSPDRKATRKQDHAALAALAGRGIDKAERDRLAALVKVVTEQKDPAMPAPAVDQERQQALQELAAWYADWSETARAVITQRSRLERLGLLHPRRAQPADNTAPTDPTAPAPEPAPAPVTTTPAAPQNGQSQGVPTT